MGVHRIRPRTFRYSREVIFSASGDVNRPRPPTVSKTIGRGIFTRPKRTHIASHEFRRLDYSIRDVTARIIDRGATGSWRRAFEPQRRVNALSWQSRPFTRDVAVPSTPAIARRNFLIATSMVCFPAINSEEHFMLWWFLEISTMPSHPGVRVRSMQRHVLA